MKSLTKTFLTAAFSVAAALTSTLLPVQNEGLALRQAPTGLAQDVTAPALVSIASQAMPSLAAPVRS